jgi:hypothetical protein
MKIASIVQFSDVFQFNYKTYYIYSHLGENIKMLEIK